MPTFSVVKRHKRLLIESGGNAIYSPPSFLRLPDRTALQWLADQLSAGRRYIDAVMDFEARYHPNKACRP